jgi:hypothetical protein
MAQDTRPISSSAPCHGAKKVRVPHSQYIHMRKDPAKFPAVKT